MIIKLYRSNARRFRAFKNKEEMNDHMAAHIFAAGKKLHKNARAALKTIANYSCVVTGVSWLNEETIAKKISVSDRTVKRAIDLLIALGIGRREVVEINGISLLYFVINPFDMSAFCPEFDRDLSAGESEPSPTAVRDEGHFFDDEPIEPSKTNNKEIVVERAQGATSSNPTVHYPVAIAQKLSEYDLKPNAATIKRWLSFANEETILQAIDHSLHKKGIRNAIGWITGVLQQGYVSDAATTIDQETKGHGSYSPKKSKRYTHGTVRRDVLPEWVARQGKKPIEKGSLTEEQKREAAELLAALDALESNAHEDCM